MRVPISCLIILLALSAFERAALAADRPIIAVFGVQGEGVKFPQKTLDGLTDYLSARLANDYQVVPRDELRSRLAQEKKSSYKACFDESCQIAIGKELAAQKSLQTRITKLGKRCIITAVLYDLARATSERSATAETECSEDGAVEALKSISEQLLGAGREPRREPEAKPKKELPPSPPTPKAVQAPAGLAGTYAIKEGKRAEGASSQGTVQFFQQGRSFGFVRNVAGDAVIGGLAIDDGDIVAAAWGRGSYGVVIMTAEGGHLSQTRDADSTGVVDGGRVELAGPPGFNGTYTVISAMFPNGNRWTGNMVITPIGADKYRVQTNASGIGSWNAVALVIGKKLVLSWGTEGEGGVIAYSKRGATLDGRLATFDFSRRDVQKETLERSGEP